MKIHFYFIVRKCISNIKLGLILLYIKNIKDFENVNTSKK